MSGKPANPFRGLKPYERIDYPNLFGRDADFVFMKDRIFGGRTTLMFAGSGVGKTSFFEAKLIPELEERHRLPLTIRYHRQWSGSDPLAAVRSTLEAGPDEPLTAFFERHPGQWILVLDQFEELFQNPDYWTTSEALRTELAAVVRSSLPVRIVISMREEFLGQLSFFDNQIPDVFRNYYRLKNPDPETAEEIIQGICVGVAVDPQGLALLVKDLAQVEIPTAAGTPRYVSQDAVFLPYMQLVCRELWEAQPDIPGQPFQFLAGYQQGSPARILEAYCAGQLTALSQAQRLMASHALDYLVATQGAKRAYTAGDLAAHMRLRKPVLLEETLAALAKAGILRGSQRGDRLWFELAHDMYAPILYRWKERFHAARRERTMRLVAGSVTLAIAAIAGVYLWSQAQVRRGLAGSLDQRAAYMELQQDRDAALMLRLRAREADPTEARERAAASVGFPPEQLLYTLRHDAPVTAMAFSPNAKYVATAARGSGGTANAPESTRAEGSDSATPPDEKTSVQVWNANGQWMGSPAGEHWNLPGEVTDIAIANSGRLLATAAESGRYPDVTTTISLFDKEGTQPPAPITMPCRLDQMRFDDAGVRLLVSCQPRPMLEWSVFDKELKTIVKGRTLKIAFSRDGRMAAVAARLGEVERWDLQSGTPAGKFKLVAPGITGLAFSADGKRLAATGRTGAIGICDTATGKLETLPNAGSIVRRVAFAQDGETLLGVRDSDPGEGRPMAGFFTRWDLRTGQKTDVAVRDPRTLIWFPLPDQGVVLERIVSRLWLWDAATGAPLRHAATVPAIRRFELSPDGKQLLTWEDGGAVHAWDTGKGQPYIGIQTALAYALDRSGSTQALLTSQRSLLVRRLPESAAGRKFTPGFDASAVALAPGGDFVAAASEDQIQMWSTQDGVEIRVPVLPHEEGGYRFWLREDGAVVALSSRSLLVMPRGETTLRPIPGIGEFVPGKNRDAMGESGRWLARTGDGLTVWDTRSGVRRQFGDVDGTPSFTVDERFLLVTSVDGNPAVFKLPEFERVNVPHAGASLVAVSPDGAYAVSAGTNPELRLWSLASKQALASIPLVRSARTVAFSPNGSLFAATDRWAFWFPISGASSGRVSRPLPTPWTVGRLALGATGATARALLEVNYKQVVSEEFDSDLSDTVPLKGTLAEWEKKLNLRLVDSELKPRYQVRVARGDSAPKR